MKKLTEQEMLSAIDSAFENGGSPDRLSRAFHRELLPELYPDYWPSYQAIRRIEAKLAK